MVVVTAVLAFVASPVYADHPLNGIYTSFAGQVEEGRFSESWVGGGQGQIGNSVHAQSWDGAVLGTQWNVLCPAISEEPVLIEDTVDPNGNGHRIYRTVYSGGSFNLSGDGDWGNGDPWYGGDLFHYVHTTTMQFVNGELVGYNTNAQLSGFFDGYENCMQLTIANAVSVDIGGVPPADYPALKTQEGGCVDVGPDVIGEWGDVWAITLVISDCATASEDVTWGAVKNLYR